VECPLVALSQRPHRLEHDLRLAASWQTPRIKEGSQTTTRRSRGDDVGTLASQRRRPRGEVETRVALVSAGTRRVGLTFGRRVASARRLGRRDGVASVAHFLCEDACAVTTGRAWAVTGSQEM